MPVGDPTSLATTTNIYGTATLAALTLILVVVTGWYAWATHAMLRIVRSDYEARYTPMIDLNVFVDRKDRGLYRVNVFLYNRGLAPVRISEVSLVHRGRQTVIDRNFPLAVGDDRHWRPEILETDEEIETLRKKGEPVAGQVAATATGLTGRPNTISAVLPIKLD